MESACNRKRKLSSVDGADDKSELSDTDDDGSKKFIGDNLQNTNSDEEDLDDNGNERIINDALESQRMIFIFLKQSFFLYILYEKTHFNSCEKN